MKSNRVIVLSIVVAVSLGLAAGRAIANEDAFPRNQVRWDPYLTTGDDSSLAPGVPGVTEENNSDLSTEEVTIVQRALKDEGYDPGRIDGAMDDNTRAAIREFQKDNSIPVTGTIDTRTAQLLELRVDRSSG